MIGDAGIYLLLHKCGVIGSAEKIIDRHPKIIGKTDEGGIIGFSRAAFVAADAVLRYIKLNGKTGL